MYPRRLALLPPSDWREHVETPSRESEDAVETERFRLGHGSGGRTRVGEMEGEGRVADESTLVVVVVVVVLPVVVCSGSGAEEGSAGVATRVSSDFESAADGCSSGVVCCMSVS